MQSCPECEDMIEGDQSIKKTSNSSGIKRYVACGCCGKPVAVELDFCNHCSAKRWLYATEKRMDAKKVHDQSSLADSGAELFRHNSAIYLRGLIPVSGALVITGHEIRFTLQNIYNFGQPVVIGLDSVKQIDCGMVASLGFVIKILLKSGLTHKFSLGVVPDSDDIREILRELNLLTHK